MATRLKKIKVNEVSLVSRPAIAKEFMLFKSEDGAMEESVVVEEVKKEEQPVVEEAPVVKEEPAPEVVKEEPKPEPAPEPAIDTQKAAEPEVEKAKKQVCPECGEEMEDEEMHKKECKKLKKEAEQVSKELELAKALESERIQKEALMKELDELKKAAEVQKEAEITKEYIEKAAVDMKNVPTVSPATFGVVLRQAARKLEKSEFDAIYTALKAANEYIGKNSQLTKELGVGGEDLSADAASQLDAIAKSYVQKDASLTYAKAYGLACNNNPQIYAEHVRQVRRQ